jgi:hypothetical protein
MRADELIDGWVRWLHAASPKVRKSHDRLLATFGDVESVGTSSREIKKLPLSHGAVFIALPWTGTRNKISKPPHFTKSGQEPTDGYNVIVPDLWLDIMIVANAGITALATKTLTPAETV